MAKKLVSVSSVDPVYNKKGTKVVGWKVVATYITMTPMEWPSTLHFYSTQITEYEYCDFLWGSGHKRALHKREKLLAKLAQSENTEYSR